MLTKEGVHSGEFSLVSQRRSGGVTFHIVNALGVYARASISPLESEDLPFGIACEVTFI